MHLLRACKGPFTDLVLCSKEGIFLFFFFYLLLFFVHNPKNSTEWPFHPAVAIWLQRSFLLQMISHCTVVASGALLSVNYDEWQMGAFVVWRQPVNPTVCTNHSQTNHFVYDCSARLRFSIEETPSPHPLPNARVERRIIPQQRPPQDHLHDDIGVMAIWKVSDSKRIRSCRNHIAGRKWKLNGNLWQR